MRSLSRAKRVGTLQGSVGVLKGNRGTMWRVYLVSALIACVVAVSTTLVTLRLAALPAPSTQGTRGGEDPSHAGNSTVVLEDVVEVPLAKSRSEPQEMEVFYKTPFAAPPHLTFPENLEGGVQVAEQKAGSFKLRRTATDGLIYVKVKWRAEGRPAQ